MQPISDVGGKKHTQLCDCSVFNTLIIYSVSLADLEECDKSEGHKGNICWTRAEHAKECKTPKWMEPL